MRTERSQIKPMRRTIFFIQLMLVAACGQAATAGGIDFDLNEPPPEEYLDVEAREEIQFGLEPKEEPPALVCPAPGRANKRRQQEQNSAVAFRERFEQVMRMQAKQTALKELPDYCDYDRFKADHADLLKEPTGASATTNALAEADERMFRRSLYLKRCLDVFRSRVEYRLGRKTYLEGVTPLSDMSPNEVGQLFMSAPPMEFRQQQHQRQAKSEQEYKAELREQRLALKANDIAFPAGQNLADEAFELKRMAEKLESGDSFAQDSLLVMDSVAVRRMIATMLERSAARLDGVDPEEYRLAIREELIGAELGHKSEACASFDDKGQVLAPYPSERWPLSDKRPPGRPTGRLPDELAAASYVVPQLESWRRQYLDWSHHKCFHRIYKQFANCGCCYVVAAVNLAEFAACTQEKDQISKKRFSEMHVLNCGLKYSPYNMGCSGGSVLETLRFIGLAGTYTRLSWRNRVAQSAHKKEFTDLRDINCPMAFDRPWAEWGRDKVLLNPVVIHPNEWLEALEDGPIVATVQMPREGIVTYTGDVHDGTSCNGSGIWHVMVLVGFGRNERGQAYWRFRNSFGPDWGDQGHFNLAMSVPGECFAGGVRVYREPVEL